MYMVSHGANSRSHWKSTGINPQLHWGLLPFLQDMQGRSIATDSFCISEKHTTAHSRQRVGTTYPLYLTRASQSKYRRLPFKLQHLRTRLKRCLHKAVSTYLRFHLKTPHRAYHILIPKCEKAIRQWWMLHCILQGTLIKKKKLSTQC